MAIQSSSWRCGSVRSSGASRARSEPAWQRCAVPIERLAGRGRSRCGAGRRCVRWTELVEEHVFCSLPALGDVPGTDGSDLQWRESARIGIVGGSGDLSFDAMMLIDLSTVEGRHPWALPRRGDRYRPLERASRVPRHPRLHRQPARRSVVGRADRSSSTRRRSGPSSPCNPCPCTRTPGREMIASPRVPPGRAVDLNMLPAASRTICRPSATRHPTTSATSEPPSTRRSCCGCSTGSGRDVARSLLRRRQPAPPARARSVVAAGRPHLGVVRCRHGRRRAPRRDRRCATRVRSTRSRARSLVARADRDPHRPPRAAKERTTRGERRTLASPTIGVGRSATSSR